MKQSAEPITGLVLDVTSHRVHYGVMEDGVFVHKRWPVLGYAAQGGYIYPVRLEDRTGRGVLCGTAADPLRENFLGVLVAGAGLEELGEEVDLQIRQMIAEDREARRAGQ